MHGILGGSGPSEIRSASEKAPDLLIAGESRPRRRSGAPLAGRAGHRNATLGGSAGRSKVRPARAHRSQNRCFP